MIGSDETVKDCKIAARKSIEDKDRHKDRPTLFQCGCGCEYRVDTYDACPDCGREKGKPSNKKPPCKCGCGLVGADHKYYASKAHGYYLETDTMCGCSHPNARPPCGFCELVTEEEADLLHSGGEEALLKHWDAIRDETSHFKFALEQFALLAEAVTIIKLGIEESDRGMGEASAKPKAKEFIKKHDKEAGKSRYAIGRN